MERKEAIEVIKKNWPDSSFTMLREALETLIPELKESEDERMIQYFKDLAPFDKADELYEKYGFSHKDAIAWLEKQGGHAKFINRIQVGDKVTRNEDGVLVNLSQLNRVAKKQGEQKPVNKTSEYLKGVARVQRYEELTDFEKVFDKIASNYAYNKNREGYNLPWYTKERAAEILYHATKQKPAWSELYIADVFEKVGLAKIVRELANDELTNALQSAMIELAKTRQIVEWSEEDEKYMNALIDKLETLNFYNDSFSIGGYSVYIIANWLKSLRPQNTWKPSEEQLQALRWVCNRTFIVQEPQKESALEDLYEQLKAL